MNLFPRRNPCRSLLAGLAAATAGAARPLEGWMQRHVDACPRCRARLDGAGRLQASLLMLRTQPHSESLLMQANRHAIAALHHDVRALPQTAALRIARPRPPLMLRLAGRMHHLAQAAACLAVLLLMRVDLASPLNKFHDDARANYQNHRAQQLDEDLRDGLL